MPRGGYRDPGPRKPPAGPGKFSQRTDGQVIEAPDLDRPDIQYGDRQMIQAAQRIQPLPAARPVPPVAGMQAAARGGLPDWLIDRPSDRPDEPITSGSPIGPGPGPEALMVPPEDQVDLREMVLDAMYTYFGNMDAYQMLQQLRTEKLQRMRLQRLPQLSAEPVPTELPEELAGGPEPRPGGVLARPSPAEEQLMPNEEAEPEAVPQTEEGGQPVEQQPEETQSTEA